MKVIREEIIVYCDVDKTLVKWPMFYHTQNAQKGLLMFDYYGTQVWLKEHRAHIDLLKSYKKRGFFVHVMSANGVQWAEEVVNRLNLAEYVDLVSTKPLKYMDDKPWDSFCNRIYLPDIANGESEETI